MKYVLQLFVTLTILIVLHVACNNTNNQSKHIDTAIVSEKEVNPIQDTNFPIRNFEKADFIQCDNEISFSKGKNYNTDKNLPKRKTYFLLAYTMSNNSQTLINDLRICASLKLRFKNENIYIYIPNGWFDEDSYDINKGLSFNDADPYSNLYDIIINATNPWIPNTNKKFIFYLGERSGQAFIGLDADLFTRTPEEAILLIKYHAVSVDGEFNNKVSYDIMDKWKAYQVRLGLRRNEIQSQNPSNSTYGNDETSTSASSELGTYFINATSSTKVYFHNTSNASTIRKAYIDSKEIVQVKKIENGFGYIEFTNNKGQTTVGWVNMANLTKE